MLHAAVGEEAEVLHAAVVDAEIAPGVADGAAELGEPPHEGPEGEYLYAMPGPVRDEILQRDAGAAVHLRVRSV